MDYSKGKIYKITGGGKCYVGSTIQPLNIRFSKHKCQKYIEEIKDCEDLAIELIEEYPCECKKDLFIRERYWIEKTECINKYIPTRTQKEYYQENKEKIKELKKKYREENKEKIKESKKEYNKINKERIKEYNKKYREENKEKIKELKKKYREKMKEKGLI